MNVKFVTLHCRVVGQVQGVGFRYATKQQADRLNLSGWVKNLADGGVEVFAQGSEDDIRALKHWLQQGPSLARVDELIVLAQHTENGKDSDAFTIRR